MGDSSRHEPWVSLQAYGWLRKPALGLNSLMQIPDKIQSSLKVGLSKKERSRGSELFVQM